MAHGPEVARLMPTVPSTLGQMAPGHILVITKLPRSTVLGRAQLCATALPSGTQQTKLSSVDSSPDTLRCQF